MVDSRAIVLAEAFLRIVHKAKENQKRPRHYGISEKLYPAEIHTIMMIGTHENAYLSELARLLGVTRGAVSQMIFKLTQKGLIEKNADPENATRFLLKLTDKGRVAFYSHQQMHAKKDAPLFEYVAELSDRKYDFAIEFLQKLEDMVDRMR